MYVFDPEVLADCARLGLDKPLDEAFDVVTEALVEQYGEYVDGGPRKWIFNNAGGAMGQLHLLHASLTEYVLLFGSAIGTEGHSGRYAVEIWDTMIDGEMWCYVEGDLQRRVYKPGDMAYLGKGMAKGYRLPERGWMLEYGRGPIPSVLPFGLADAMLSTLDMSALARTMGGYTRHVVRNLMRGKI